MRAPFAGSVGCAALLAIVLAAMSDGAQGEPLTSEGITFSDELGGFVIRSLSGTGRLDDPFVLVEEVTGDGEAVLVVRGLENTFGNRVDTQHATGFALHKVVINSTNQNWITYEIELRENRTASSPYEDGLSFGQAADRPPEQSDRFKSVANVDEPYDGLSFRGGATEPGSAVTFTMIVTDETPEPAFLIVQHALLVVSDARPSDAGLEPPAPDGYAALRDDFVDGVMQ
jgi:hypothetical protein